MSIDLQSIANCIWMLLLTDASHKCDSENSLQDDENALCLLGGSSIDSECNPKFDK